MRLVDLKRENSTLYLVSRSHHCLKTVDTRKGFECDIPIFYIK